MTAQPHTTRHAPRSADGHLARVAAAGALTAVLLGIAPYAHAADGGGRAAPEPPAKGAASAAHQAAGDEGTLRTLSRFFARDGAVSVRKAAPAVVGKAVPVYTLSAEFVAASTGRATSTPVAELEVFATEAVSSDGQRASVMATRADGKWRVVNIATGDDETRYAAMGAKKAPGGTVFQEPQIDAWYVLSGTRVLPLDPDARKAIGRDGTSVAAFHTRVHAEYADKLPGSAYDRKGLAGGFGPNGHNGRADRSGPSDHGGSSGHTGPSDVHGEAADVGETAARANGQGGGQALGAVGATAGAGALALAAAAGGTWLIRRRRGAARG